MCSSQFLNTEVSLAVKVKTIFHFELFEYAWGTEHLWFMEYSQQISYP